jgi:FkbM family methyltransferase
MPGIGKTLRDIRYRLFYKAVMKGGVALEKLGDERFGLQWTICPTALNRSSIVYSAGVGNDISFERTLVKRFGCDIVLCDPSPVAAKTMALSENKIPQFHFHPLALAAREGHITVSHQTDKEGQTWFARAGADGGDRIASSDLSSLMKQHGHTYIDLLKIDIEGSEYEVIEDLVARAIPIGQLCVEYHHGVLPGYTRMQSVRSMFRLVRNGFQLVHQEVCNHTFLKKTRTG